MISNRYALLLIISILLLTGETALAREDAARGGGADVIKSDYAGVGEERTDYPRGWYYYGNPESDFFQGSSPYEPYYAYPPPDDAALAFQTIYIEQDSNEKTTASEPDDWNYCAQNKGYFPYVNECPAAWQKIASQPFGQEPGYWYYCDDPAGYYPYVRQCTLDWKKTIP